MGMVVSSKIEAFAQWLDRIGWQKLEKLGLVLLTCILILVAMNLLAKAARRAASAGLASPSSDMERRAKTLGSVLNNTARILVAVFFILMVLTEFGVNIQPLLAGSAVAGVALGFGAQALVKDIIAGFFLLLENQFVVGDVINVDDKHMGTVERMTLRITQLRDLEGRVHYLPNGTITKVIVLTKDYAQAVVDVEIRVEEDFDHVTALLQKIGQELQEARPEWIQTPTEVKGIESFTAVGIVIRTVTRTNPGMQWDAARELRRRFMQGFRQAGIQMPLPQNVVWHRTEEPSPVKPEEA